MSIAEMRGESALGRLRALLPSKSFSIKNGIFTSEKCSLLFKISSCFPAVVVRALSHPVGFCLLTLLLVGVSVSSDPPRLSLVSRTLGPSRHLGNAVFLWR